MEDKNKIAYIGVKGLITNMTGEILITREPLTFVGGGKWELPGGKISNDEEKTPLEEILKREITEELGEKFKVSIGPVIDIMRRPWNKPGARADQVMLAVFLCTYQSGEVILSEENREYAWISKEQLPRYEFIPGYQRVLEKFFSAR